MVRSFASALDTLDGRPYSEDFATRSPSRCRSPPSNQAPARARLFPGWLIGLKGARLSNAALRSRTSLLLRGLNTIVQRGLNAIVQRGLNTIVQRVGQAIPERE